MQWYYQKDGADEGPFEAERMRELIASVLESIENNHSRVHRK